MLKIYRFLYSLKTNRHYYFITIALVFLFCFFFFDFDYRYIDDYKLFAYNGSVRDFLQSYRWGFSRIIGNYFFGLLFFPQNNIFLNISVVTVHVLNGVLLFSLAKRHLSKLSALILGMFFISIPITSEAFFWGIAGQVVYAVFFFLLAALLYQRYKTQLTVKHCIGIVLLFTLSISFYEVFILFPFLLALTNLLRKKDRLLPILLSGVSTMYLFLLKFLTTLTGGNITAQQKTNTIAFSDIPERITRIISDVFQVFFGKVAGQMYGQSIQDVLKGHVAPEFIATLIVLFLLTLVSLWMFHHEADKGKDTETVAPPIFITALGILIGLSLSALLTLPVNYFHDLRTYYPFTVSLTLLIGAYLSLYRNKRVLLNLHLTVLTSIIVVNMLVLKIENNQYVAIYQHDWPFIQTLEDNARNGIHTIIYLPGYNADKPLALQMNLAYYPESNFIYGTHMLHAFSIVFTKEPYVILGNRQIIEAYAQANPSYQRVYDFVRRKTVTVEEFLSTAATGTVDLTMLPPESYRFQDVDHNIQKYDASVIQNRKLYKSFITHPNCSESPATLYVTTPTLTQTCEASFRLLTVKDVERRTTSDGVDFKFYVNDALKDTIHLNPDDAMQSQKQYHYSVEPGATGSAQLRFEVTDGGKRNCNDDKIFIAEPILRCGE